MTSIECLLADTWLQKVYNFLSNPFFVMYLYECQNPDRLVDREMLTIPKVGIIDVVFQKLENFRNNSGRIGLSRKSKFLETLPVNYQMFSIFINSNEFDYQMQSQIVLGGYSNYLIGTIPPAIPLLLGTNQWQVAVESVEVNGLKIQVGAAVFDSSKPRIVIPARQYQAVQRNFFDNLDCRKSLNKKIYCPCESGDIKIFPTISFNINKEEYQMEPEAYVRAEEERCQILIEQAQEESSSTTWILGTPFFKDKVIAFQKNHLRISKASPTNTPISNLKSPIQAVLNSSVILILCIFVSLVLIEVIRRVSGLADARTETIHDIMMRRHD